MTFRPLALASVLAVSLMSATVTPQPALAQEEPVRIAVVNMDRAIAESTAGIALNEKLAAFQAETQEQVDRQQKHLQELRQKITAAVSAADSAQIQNMQKQFEEASLALRRFTDDKSREAQKIRTEGLKDIEKQFQPVFEAIQEEFDYDLILNQQSGVVMMVGDRINITQTVIDRLK